MIPRYSPNDVAVLFSDESRFDGMLEVELLAAEGLASIGALPADEVGRLRARRPIVDAAFVRAVDEREQVTNHDTAAFVDVVQAAIGMPEAAWVHYGLTSSDVVDTALCRTLATAMDIVIDEAINLRDALTRRAVESIDVPIAGRTHGMHAEPTTYGAKFSLWALQVQRDIERARRARVSIAVGKLSGAVGTFSNIDPAVEAYVCEHLGLVAVPATQVIARDRHAEVLYACASIGTAVEQFALEVRHLARSEVGEAEEPFRAGQKGSSAMPHKRNPVLSERLCGLARVLRGYLQAGLEDVALWHERDISHSSVERMIAPDATTTLAYMLERATALVDGLVVNVEGLQRNLDRAGELYFSEAVLLALVQRGRPRQAAYEIVRRCAMKALGGEGRFRALLAEDAELQSLLPREELERCFDLQGALAHVGTIIDRAIGAS